MPRDTAWDLRTISRSARLGDGDSCDPAEPENGSCGDSKAIDGETINSGGTGRGNFEQRFGVFLALPWSGVVAKGGRTKPGEFVRGFVMNGI